MNRGFRSYAQYRNDGTRELPLHWRSSLLKRILTVQSGDMISVDDTTPDGYPVVGGNGVRGFAPKWNTERDTIVVGRVGAKCGCVHVLRERFWASEHAFRVVARAPYSLEYMARQLDSMNLNRHAITTAQPLLNTEIVTRQSVCLPPLEEQVQIAQFLDYETARIDALIEKQQQLIALLKEKRQAVISHAVTKGLNPNAPVRDSGVEWLGLVPVHWQAGRYKFCTTRVVVGIAEAATHAYADVGTPIIRSTNIKEDGLSQDGLLFIKPWFAAQNSSKFLYTGDIVTVRTGYPGVSAVVPPSLDRSQCFTNLIATPNGECEAEFLCEYLNSHLGRKYFELLGWGSAQKNISVPILQNIPVVWPPKDEQTKIVTYIREQRRKFASLERTAEAVVSVLQERRTALISAAVTGKIDVRGWRPPEPAVEQDIA